MRLPSRRWSTSAPNSPQKSRLEPPRKGRFGGGWTRSLTNLRKEAQGSSSVANPISSGSISSRDTGSASGARPIPKSSLSTTAIPTPPAVPRTTQSPSSSATNSAPAKGLRAFFQQFKRSQSTPAPVRSEKSTVQASAPASRPDVAVTGGLSSGRSSSAGSKERVAHDEISAQDDPVVMTPSQKEADDSAPLEPVNVDVSSTPNDDREGEKGAQEAEEVDPANIPLPASPAIEDTPSFEPTLPLEPAASLPSPLPIFDDSSISVEPLDRTISKESEGVPSLVHTDKAGEDHDENGTEAGVEGEQLVTPINGSETTGVVRVFSTDRIEEEDEDEAEREEEKETESTADVKPVELGQDVQEPATSEPTQERPIPDTTSPTLGGDTGSPKSTSNSRGNTSVSPSGMVRERSPVHGSAGQYGQPQQQHQQSRQQYQRQPYPHHQQQQPQRLQQYQQQYQQQQQHQQYSTSTGSGSQSLGRSGSRQIRQSVYGLNKVSLSLFRV